MNDVIDFFTGQGKPGFFNMLARIHEHGLSEPKFYAAAEALYNDEISGKSKTKPINHFREIKRRMREVDATKFYAERKLLRRADRIIEGLNNELAEEKKVTLRLKSQQRILKQLLGGFSKSEAGLKRSLRVLRAHAFCAYAAAVVCISLYIGGL